MTTLRSSINNIFLKVDYFQWFDLVSTLDDFLYCYSDVEYTNDIIFHKVIPTYTTMGNSVPYMDIICKKSSIYNIKKELYKKAAFIEVDFKPKKESKKWGNYGWIRLGFKGLKPKSISIYAQGSGELLIELRNYLKKNFYYKDRDVKNTYISLR